MPESLIPLACPRQVPLATNTTEVVSAIIISEPSVKKREESAGIDPHRHVAAGQRYATTHAGRLTAESTALSSNSQLSQTSGRSTWQPPQARCNETAN